MNGTTGKFDGITVGNTDSAARPIDDLYLLFGS
jgi:hypothetical protein